MMRKYKTFVYIAYVKDGTACETQYEDTISAKPEDCYEVAKMEAIGSVMRNYINPIIRKVKVHYCVLKAPVEVKRSDNYYHN